YRPAEALKGQIALGVRAYLPIPRCKSQKWKDAAAAGQIRPMTRPDIDNLLKHVMDCLTLSNFWEDDRQVVEYLPGTGKYYSSNPRWEIEIRETELCRKLPLL
ncbi:MAG: RusA family crossover junction endodeoxyribonuclease, partial [Desulfovibrionaceae bacterium]|nr:RusA family crossover junction endodeoxyribonuclease [Desulfovibrionaceae bacterium]